MRVSDGSGTQVASNPPPQTSLDAWKHAQAAASNKPAPTTPSSTSASGTHTSPSSGAKHGSGSSYELGSRANLRGYAFSDKGSVSVKSNGDFEVGRTSSFNYVSPDLSVTATQSSSLKVKTVKPGEKPNGESQSTESTDDKSNPLFSKGSASLVGVQGSAGASAWSQTFSNSHAYFSASVLGVQASGQAGVSITHDGITASASGSVGAYLVDTQAGFQGGPLTASGDASVGAGANANAQVAFNPLKGDVGVSGGGSAFAGAQANETGSLGVAGTSVSETAGVGAGIGIDGKADLGIKDGDISANFDVGGYLGVGGNVDVSFNVNVPKAADDAWHAITSFI
jgi:hypothetical protein